MAELDHLTLFVRDHQLAARWYVENLGFEVEFETPDGDTTAVRDTKDFTIFLTNRAAAGEDESRCVLYFKVADVDEEYERLLANGVVAAHGPRETPWGYGPELRDPDGHGIRLWDARSAE